MAFCKFRTIAFLILWISFLIADVYSYELLLVQVVWRHGDRTPTGTYPNDPNQENAWPQGWGALTVRGMEQQVKFGKLLRNEYVERLNFLSSGYKSDEMYIRSTDVNRTLRSAECNLIGMYYNSPALRPSIDYPNISWPHGYVPIPVHSVNKSTDYIAYSNCYCPRRNWLWDQAKKTPEFQKLNQSNQDLFRNLTELCGEAINLDNIRFIQQTTRIEKEYDKKTMIDNLLYDRMMNLTAVVDDMQNGIGINPYNGIDFHVEIAKVRGGSMLWAMMDRIDHKIYCQSAPNDTNCKWINSLKYYAYSAHDNTIVALLTTLGAKTALIPFGYPGYAAAVVVELWKDTKNNYFMQFRYHRFNSDILENVTNTVDGCQNYTFMCPYSIVRQKAFIFYPGNPAKLCEDVTSKSTNFTAPESANLNERYFLKHDDASEGETLHLPWRMELIGPFS